jgi:hypothetical protein
MERIEFWRNELQGARLYDGARQEQFQSDMCGTGSQQ